MYYTEFKSWLDEQNVSTKIQKDYVSRLKAIQRDLSPYYDILEEYRINKCQEILRFFDDKGFLFKVYCEKTQLPIGKPYISAYKLALKKYIMFLEIFLAEK